MKTRIYNHTDLLTESVRLDIKTTFLEGRNVVFPTETVYGIGANALSKKGVEGIYNLKGRPSDNPLIMHLSKKEDITPYIKNKLPYVDKLMEAFWPGPITLVFEKSDLVPNNITGGLNTIGIRIPDSEIARKIIDIAGVPISAPSANISGRPSATLFNHVLEDFEDKVDIIIDGGKSKIGLESTVVDVTKPIPVILRPGMITKKMIEEVVGEVLLAGEIKEDDIPKAPGMKYKHYAPKGKLAIVVGDELEVINYINKMIKLHSSENKTVGIITPSEYRNEFETDLVFSIGNLNDETEIASNLFAALRKMDKKNIDYIYSFSFEKGKYAEAIMNRLYKAANKNIIKL